MEPEPDWIAFANDRMMSITKSLGPRSSMPSTSALAAVRHDASLTDAYSDSSARTATRDTDESLSLERSTSVGTTGSVI